MELNLFVIGQDDKKVPIVMHDMSPSDAETTRNAWASDWTSDFIQSPSHINKVAKTYDGEIVALACYQHDSNNIIVEIVFVESEPNSNPALVSTRSDRRFLQIGRALIAYGIAMSVNSGYGGAVTFSAKTTELLAHYVNDFGAYRLPSLGGNLHAPRLIIEGDAAKHVIAPFLS